MGEGDVTEQAPVRPRRKALGRGLDALLPAVPQAGVREVEVDRIERNPNQPRQRFERSALEDLASSIREHGIVQPLLVTSIGDERYRLIIGERRWQASRIAGLKRVPVIVKDATDRQTLELALIENIQRADLNPLEEASAYERLVKDFGLTQQEVADRMGKSRVTVTNMLRLLALPESAKRALAEARISEGHARALLSLPAKEGQLALLERIQRSRLTVRQTEDLVRQLLEGTRTLREPRTLDPNVRALEESLQRSLGTRVRVQPSRRGGRIVIEYYSNDEFDSLYRRLTGDEA